MYEYKTIIDKSGYIINQCVLFVDEVPQNFILIKREHLAVNLCEEIFLRGRLVDDKWIETASCEELEKYNQSIGW